MRESGRLGHRHVGMQEDAARLPELLQTEPEEGSGLKEPVNLFNINNL